MAAAARRAAMLLGSGAASRSPVVVRSLATTAAAANSKAAASATPAKSGTFEELLRQHFAAAGTLAGTPVRLVQKGERDTGLGHVLGGGRSAAAQRQQQQPASHARMDDEAELLASLSAAQKGGSAMAAGTAVPLVHDFAPTAVLESFTIETLLRANVHLGHSTGAVHRNMLPYLLGERNGIHLIDLEHTQVALRRAINVVREVAARGGIILFVGTRPELADLMVACAGRSAQYHVIHKWVPGTLTNMGETVGRRTGDPELATPARVRGFGREDDDEDDGGRGRDVSNDDSPSDGAIIAAALDATKRRPDLLLMFDPLLNDIALREAERCHVPTIGLADTNFDPRRLTYPIPANDDSLLSVAYIASILANASLEGMLAAANAGAAAAASAPSVGRGGQRRR